MIKSFFDSLKRNYKNWRWWVGITVGIVLGIPLIILAYIGEYFYRFCLNLVDYYAELTEILKRWIGQNG